MPRRDGELRVRSLGSIAQGSRARSRPSASPTMALTAAFLCCGFVTRAVAAEPPPAITLQIAPVPSAPIADGFTLATVGDIIYLRPMLATIEKRSPGLVQLLSRADVTFGNLETSVIDLGKFNGSPMAEDGPFGSWLFADPRVPQDLVHMGFKVVSTANNHTADWGHAGTLETIDRMSGAGLAYAGTGRTLSAARAPHYLDTQAGRVGLVAATSSFFPHARAGDPAGEAPGRPGVNALRLTSTGLVSASDLAVLARISGTKPGDEVVLGSMAFGQAALHFRSTPTPSPTVTVDYAMNESDVAANLTSVRRPSRTAISRCSRCTATSPTLTARRRRPLKLSSPIA